jgi:hypothetical protein
MLSSVLLVYTRLIEPPALAHFPFSLNILQYLRLRVVIELEPIADRRRTLPPAPCPQQTPSTNQTETHHLIQQPFPSACAQGLAHPIQTASRTIEFIVILLTDLLATVQSREPGTSMENPIMIS